MDGIEKEQTPHGRRIKVRRKKGHKNFDYQMRIFQTKIQTRKFTIVRAENKRGCGDNGDYSKTNFVL